jgi:hypothetical protein
MDSAAQLKPDGLALCHLPDLRGIPLSELAGMVGDGDDAISGVVVRTVGGQENPSLVRVTSFNSSI